MAISSSPPWHHPPSFYAWNCCHQTKPRRLFFHPSRCVLCLNSRCFNISFRELILYSSIFEKINPSIVSFCHHRVVEDLKSEDVKINVCNESTALWVATWIVKIMLACVPPFTLPYTWISGRNSCLVGVSCHSPSSALAWLCLFIMPSCLNSKESWIEVVETLRNQLKNNQH